MLNVENLVVTYPGKEPTFAVRGVSFSVSPGETVALVGESGSGKTSVGRALAGLQEITAGQVILDNDIYTWQSGEPAAVQMVFQDTLGSLDPRWTVERSLLAALGPGRRRAAQNRGRAAELLGVVGLSDEFLQRRPHSLSGGQAQRVCLARAFLSEPRFLVLDEPTAALDRSLRRALLEELSTLQARTGVGYLFITHDLESARTIADRVIVMYHGRIVEEASTESVFSRPWHPYTEALLDTAPTVGAGRLAEVKIPRGETPSAKVTIPGCSFASRCPYAIQACIDTRPETLAWGPQHHVACHRVADRFPGSVSGQYGRAVR